MRILIFNASYATTELGPALKWALTSDCGNCIEIDSLRDVTSDDLVIIICPAGIKDRKDLPPNFIAYQLEPHMSPSFNESLEILKKAVTIWDYSRDNIDILWKKHQLHAFYVPIGFTPALSHLLAVTPIERRSQEWDIAFFGNLSERRLKLKEICEKEKLNVLFHQALTLKAMMRELSQTKIALNVHARDGPFLLETVRLSLLLIAGCCVVSEVSSDKEVMEEYHAAGVTFVEYDQLVPTAQALLKDDIQRKALAEKSRAWYLTAKNWSEIINWKVLIYATLFPKENSTA